MLGWWQINLDVLETRITCIWILPLRIQLGRKTQILKILMIQGEKSLRSWAPNPLLEYVLILCQCLNLGVDHTVHSERLSVHFKKKICLPLRLLLKVVERLLNSFDVAISSQLPLLNGGNEAFQRACFVFDGISHCHLW